MVEYVLLMVVTVSMLLALVYQVFKPFQSFVKSYMGDYTACLLETGELPSLGNSDAQAALSDEGCDAKFESATLAGGRPPRSSSSSSSGQTNPPPKEDSPSSSSSSRGGGGGSPAGVSPSSSSSNNLLIASMKPKTGTEGGEGPSDKVTEVPLAEGSKFYNRKDSYSQDFTARNGKQIIVPLSGVSEEEKKKRQRAEGNRRTVASGEDLAGPSKKTAVKPPPAKPVVEPDDSPLTFGNFFRFLLIAAIVIAIIVVLGSQALKIAKSQEK